MPKKRLPAAVYRAAWEEVAKGRAGIGWDGVVEQAWKNIGGIQEEMMSVDKFGTYKTKVEGLSEKLRCAKETR